MSDHADAWWAGWTGLVVVIFLAWSDFPSFDQTQS